MVGERLTARISDVERLALGDIDELALDLRRLALILLGAAIVVGERDAGDLRRAGGAQLGESQHRAAIALPGAAALGRDHRPIREARADAPLADMTERAGDDRFREMADHRIMVA